MSQDQDDQRRRIAARSEPIEPIRQRSHFPETRVVPSPQWSKWNLMHEVELWEAVSLSANLEPDEMPVYLGAFDKLGDDPFRICPEVFRERLIIANSNACRGFGLKVVHPLKARCLVTLPEFWQWASSVWEELPAEYSSKVEATPSAGEAAKQSQPMPAARDASSVTKMRREGDILSPLIVRAWKEDQAWSRGEEPTTASVFLTLRGWAESIPPVQPLRGITETGIKWVDDSDKPRELTKKLLGERLKGIKGQR